MATISQIEVNGTNYDICDATARDSISSIGTWIGAGPNSDITLSNSGITIPLNVIVGNGNGTVYNISNNQINITESGVYLVWGMAYFYSGYTVNDIIHLHVKRDSTSAWLSHTTKRAQFTSPYETAIISPTPIIVSNEDSVFLQAWNQSGARGTLGHGEDFPNRTGIFVLKIN